MLSWQGHVTVKMDKIIQKLKDCKVVTFTILPTLVCLARVEGCLRIQHLGK
jgi:hypothetical protein